MADELPGALDSGRRRQQDLKLAVVENEVVVVGAVEIADLVEAAAGYGISREAGRTSEGFQFRTGSYLWWEWRRWALEVGGTFGQSRRDSVYRSHFFTASISRSF